MFILNTEVIDIDELSVKPMTRAIFDQLTARGKVFEKIALGHHYLNYERFIFYQHAAFRVHYTKANLSLPLIISLTKLTPYIYILGGR